MKQITIYDLLPLVDDKWNWAFCDSDGLWHITKNKPTKGGDDWIINHDMKGFMTDSFCFFFSLPFIIKPFDGDWKDSLIKIDHFHQQGKMVKEEE